MKKIVVIGGGSGASSVLEGLQSYRLSVTSVCTAFDNGEHSGELRDVHGILPPGDARRHLIARARQGGFLRQLFAHRFNSNGSKAKSLGNLMMLGASEVAGGDQKGLDELCKMFGIDGRILYVSTDDAHLCAELDDGTVLVGEDKIDLRLFSDKRMIKYAFLKPTAYIQNDVHEAIVEADAVIFTPGDLYGSIIANTLVAGFSEAIRQTKARLINVTNVVTKANETRGFTASMFSRTLLHYIDRDRFDVVFCNNASIDEGLARAYLEQEAVPVSVDADCLRKYANNLVVCDLLNQSAKIARHDPHKLGRAIMEVVHES